MFQFLKSILGGASDADFKGLVAAGALIVDVRNPDEYASGHIKGSVNIPLGQIGQHFSTLQNKKVPIIAVCRSGARSGAAVDMLRNKGIEAYNGGSWDGLKATIA
ncbi:MAG: rhodanese-like domain-containing protein [Saprospiraceae bacterium]